MPRTRNISSVISSDGKSVVQCCKSGEIRAYMAASRVITLPGLLSRVRGASPRGAYVVAELEALGAQLVKREETARIALAKLDRPVHHGTSRIREHSAPLGVRTNSESRPRRVTLNDSELAHREHVKTRRYVEELDEIEKRSARRRVGRKY